MAGYLANCSHPAEELTGEFILGLFCEGFVSPFQVCLLLASQIVDA